ncbi:MAG: peptidoglycan DD-metalloendopeptidase family protein [Solobacterium sp.]|nr:peptidoglycan DD-metalloendopeptidase family protein [Solobacterium sp.]
MAKKIMTIAGCLAAALLIVFFVPYIKRSFSAVPVDAAGEDAGKFGQTVEYVYSEPVSIRKIYLKGELLGVLNDEQKFNDHLDDVYHTLYEEKFPDSRAYPDKDIYITTEQSYFRYTDADDEILKYMDENELYSLQATQVSFSENDEVYARIFVANSAIYEEAMQEYISMFISPESLALLTSGDTVPELTNYGSRDIGISITQTITTSQDYAAPSEIMTTKEEILEYIEYGDNPEKQYYTVKQYDTVAGVGTKNFGLSATQVMNINRDKIFSVDQVLKEGDELCVTYFRPVIEVIVYKEALRQQDVYFETVMVEDDTILKGETKKIQDGANGSKNTLFSEKWINGVLVTGVEKSSVETIPVQNEVIAVGTMELPDVGTGIFRFPVDNPHISCGWGCYYGHRGTDVQNRYNLWGDVLAADRGVIIENSYNGIGGNLVVIDHNNGYTSYYGHMREPSFLPVGTIVDKGQVIGHIGMTGWATGPHVHFYLTYNGERRDACTVLNCTPYY